MKTANITEQEEMKIGEVLVDVLKLRKSPEHKDRYVTTWGDKTALGVYRTVYAIVTGLVIAFVITVPTPTDPPIIDGPHVPAPSCLSVFCMEVK